MERTIDVVKIFLNSDCNIRCRYCLYADFMGNGKEDMSLDRFRTLLDESNKLGARKVVILGGEPFLSEKLEPFVERIAENGMVSTITTNGTIDLEHRLPHLISLGLQEIVFNIDSSRRDIYVGKNIKLDSILANIQIARELGLSTQVNTVLTKDNVDQIEKIIETVVSYGVDVHRIINFTPYTPEQLKFWLPPAEWLAHYERIKSFVARYNGSPTSITFQTGYDSKEGETNSCKLLNPNSRAYITANGEIFPCVLFFTKEDSLGNVKDNSLVEIWQNSPKWELYGANKEGAPTKLCSSACLAYDHLIPNFHRTSMEDARESVGKVRGYRPICPLVSEVLN